MTTFWTGTMIKEKIERDLDLEDEEFISDDEMLGYINEGIDEAEAEIQDLYEDYFLKKDFIALVNGTEEYSLPADIYAMKIRRIIYKSGSIVYTINRIKDWKKFEEYALEAVNQTSTRYMYFPINSTPGAPKLLLSPSAKETSSTNVTIWYLRNAARLASFSDTCDIPEFVNFVMQYVKVRCYEKEVGHPNLQKAMLDLEQQRSQMQSTLTGMVPDADNEIEPDLRLYEEMS
jgi:hypothetical protein